MLHLIYVFAYLIENSKHFHMVIRFSFLKDIFFPTSLKHPSVQHIVSSVFLCALSVVNFFKAFPPSKASTPFLRKKENLLSP